MEHESPPNRPALRVTVRPSRTPRARPIADEELLDGLLFALGLKPRPGPERVVNPDGRTSAA